MKTLLALILLLQACGTEQEEPCITETTFTVCAEDRYSGDAVITEIRETNNVCEYTEWRDEGLKDCSMSEETGDYSLLGEIK